MTYPKPHNNLNNKEAHKPRIQSRETDVEYNVAQPTVYTFFYISCVI